MQPNISIFNPRISLKFCLFVFITSLSFLSAQDSTVYNINDPRNPKCPCHKYQKQADDEFKKLLASANKNSNDFILSPNSGLLNGNINSSGSVNSDLSENNQIVPKECLRIKRKHFSLFKHKRKNRIKQHPKWQRVFDTRNWKILKRLRKLDSCFHWR